MTTKIVSAENMPFVVRLKSLDDDGLLNIWEETLELARMLREEWGTELEVAPEYERLIVQELQLRSSKGHFDAGYFGGAPFEDEDLEDIQLEDVHNTLHVTQAQLLRHQNNGDNGDI